MTLEKPSYPRASACRLAAKTDRLNSRRGMRSPACRIPIALLHGNRSQQVLVAPSVVSTHRHRTARTRHCEHAGVEPFLLQMTGIHEVVDEERQFVHAASRSNEVPSHAPSLARQPAEAAEENARPDEGPCSECAQSSGRMHALEAQMCRFGQHPARHLGLIEQ